MRPTMIIHVTRKEILSTLRDRRAIVSNLLHTAGAAAGHHAGPAAGGRWPVRAGAETVTEVGIQGAANLPAEMQAVLISQNVSLIEADDPEAAVRDGHLQVAIAVPSDFQAAIERGERTEITLYNKLGNLRSEVNANKIEAAVRAYRQQLVADRLAEVGLAPEVLEPIVLATVDASSEAERSSGQLAWLIPFFIAIWTLIGGQMTAIDATAGEKERGTLEALLVAPIRRVEVGGRQVPRHPRLRSHRRGHGHRGLRARRRGHARHLPAPAGERCQRVRVGARGALDVNLVTVLMLFLSALLLASLIAALLLSITMFARSFKEAQSYVAPLSFLLIIPALGLQFKDLLDLGDIIYLVPIFNVLVLMDDIVKGAASASAVLLSWGSLLVAVALLLAFAYRNFRREGVIFRT